MLFSFLDSHPEVSLDLHATTDHVDLVTAGFDLALRAGRVRDPNLIAIRLATTWLRAVASPAYLDANGRPSSVDDLAAHACLRGFEPDGRPADRWPTRDGGSARVHGRIASNDLGLLLEAALDGRGIALLPGMFSDHHVEQGRLEVVLEDQIGQTSGLHLVYPEREFLPP
jgi:DNA-binding transcriptional LysR family regulator